MHLNHRAAALAVAIQEEQVELRAQVELVGETRVIDLGIQARGGLEAGRRLAELGMAGLGQVSYGMHPLTAGLAVMVRTDAPLLACLAAQYAGWEVRGENFFAMGSGPMRAAYAAEPLFETLLRRERTDVAVGVLESNVVPPEAVCVDLAQKCGVTPHNLTLVVAPTASQAGNVQVVARSVETAMHKLHELGFDLTRVESGWGIAPLPPVAADTLTGIGRTNDAILYGGHVVLYVRGDDQSIAAVGPLVPSIASPDYGRPFREIFDAHGKDFYQIDPHLFSPAMVEFVNLDTGYGHAFGQFNTEVLRTSMQIEGSEW